MLQASNDDRLRWRIHSHRQSRRRNNHPDRRGWAAEVFLNKLPLFRVKISDVKADSAAESFSYCCEAREGSPLGSSFSTACAGGKPSESAK